MSSFPGAAPARPARNARRPVPLTLPVGATARRPEWADLPTTVRAALIERLGSEVVATSSKTSGFTSGFASVLALADGRTVFVKAAPERTGWLRDAYATEVRMLAGLPGAVRAPRVREVVEVGGWFAVVFDAVAGRPPARPWRADEADRTLDAVAEMSLALTPAPAGLALGTAALSLAEAGPSWLTTPVSGRFAPYADDIARLLGRAETLLAGDTLVHFDLRDDNVILADDDESVWVCDWNWPVSGPRWADLVCVLISMHGDGLDAEARLRASPLVEPTDHEGIDCLLAFLLGYFVLSAARPDEPSSPYIRPHQRWYVEATGSWLAERRGWPPPPSAE